MTERRPQTRRRTLAALLGVTAVALIGRLWALGWRIAHQDEGRVADWTLHYMRTGAWEYRPIIHGPFLPHINGVLFDLLGPSDFVMRLAPAVIGGLLPLAAWLLRDRLRDAEIIGTALILAANPVLLYYSRFMRNDVLLAAFAMFAFAFVVRAIDTGQRRYLYAAGFVFGLAMATKENVLLYPLCWGGALVLLFDHRIVLRDTGALTRTREVLQNVAHGVRGWLPHIIATVCLWAVVTIAFYAPKPELYTALQNPGQLPGVIDEATIGSWNRFMRLWGDPDARGHAYLEFARPYWEVMRRAALPAMLFGVLGFLLDRYRGNHPRDVVAACFYWAAASTLGYPIVMDIVAAWSNVHAIVPLAVPAGVGLGAVYTRAKSAVDRVGVRRSGTASAGFIIAAGSAILVANRGVVGILSADPLAILGALGLTSVLAIAAAAGHPATGIPALSLEGIISGLLIVVLLVTALQTGTVAHQDVYANAQGPDNQLIQYAQPAGEMQPALAALERVADDSAGSVDIAFYGEVTETADGIQEYHFYTPADYFRDNPRYGPDAPNAHQGWPVDDTPAPGWFSRLPFPWYTSQMDADVTSTTEADFFAQNSPPIVVAYASDNRETTHSAADIEEYLGGYERHRYQLYQFAEPIVVFIRTDA